MKIRILSDAINHNGKMLEQYEIYDLPDKTAKEFLDEKLATLDGVEKKEALPEPEPTPRPDEPVETYVGEAVLTPEQRQQLEAEGKLNDEKPVVVPIVKDDVVELEPDVTTTPGKGGEGEEQDTPPDDTAIGREQ